MTNLSLVSLDDLLNEVFSRFDGCIFMGVQRETKVNVDNYFRRWSGGRATCLGLCYLLHKIIEDDCNIDKDVKS